MRRVVHHYRDMSGRHFEEWRRIGKEVGSGGWKDSDGGVVDDGTGENAIRAHSGRHQSRTNREGGVEW